MSKYFEKVPEIIWSPLTSAALVALAGGIGLIFGHPWLFPSLGPTAFMQTHTPNANSAKLYNVIAGHAIGIVVGFFCVYTIGLTHIPKHPNNEEARIFSSILTVGLTIFLQIPLRAFHPPAAATTLLITLGVLKPDWNDVASLVLGILIVALAGEMVRRARADQNS